MADKVIVENARYMRRNPWGVVGLSFVTFGVYYVVWYYKTNNHLRNYGVEVSPAKATLAITLGALVVIPTFVSSYNTAERIRQVQIKSGTEERIIPVLALLLLIVVGIFAAPYYQSQINKAWDAEVAKGATVEQ